MADRLSLGRNSSFMSCEPGGTNWHSESKVYREPNYTRMVTLVLLKKSVYCQFNVKDLNNKDYVLNFGRRDCFICTVQASIFSIINY